MCQTDEQYGYRISSTFVVTYFCHYRMKRYRIIASKISGQSHEMPEILSFLHFHIK